jgi:hypothetical protein
MLGPIKPAHTLPVKPTPESTDRVLIIDASDGNKLKSVEVSNFVTGVNTELDEYPIAMAIALS